LVKIGVNDTVPFTYCSQLKSILLSGCDIQALFLSCVKCTHYTTTTRLWFWITLLLLLLLLLLNPL